MSTVDKILIGVAVGAVLGVLYAPDKGSATRRKLSRAGNDIRDKFNDLSEKINDKISGVKNSVADAEDAAYREIYITETESSMKPF